MGKQRWGRQSWTWVLPDAFQGRDAVTGWFESGVVTGQVTMAASLPGVSPAGVRLSVAEYS